MTLGPAHAAYLAAWASLEASWLEDAMLDMGTSTTVPASPATLQAVAIAAVDSIRAMKRCAKCGKMHGGKCK